MRIDVHTHFHSPALFEKFDGLGGFKELVGLQVLGVHRRIYWERRFSIGLEGIIDERFSGMADAGVDMQIISIGAYQPYFREARAAVEAARFANDLYADLATAHPERFAVWACLPLPHIADALAELKRVLADPAHVGITLGCSALGKPLDDAMFDPLWAELDRRGTIVFLHPGVQMASIPGAEDFHLGPDFCSPSEIAVAAARLVVCGVTARFPNIRFLLSTTGGGLPFFLNRFDHGFRQQQPGEYERIGGVTRHFRGFWYDTSVIEEPLVLFAAKAMFGADRLMLGSDTPRIEPILAVDYVRSSPYLDDAEKDMILDRTAATLLGRGGCACTQARAPAA